MDNSRRKAVGWRGEERHTKFAILYRYLTKMMMRTMRRISTTAPQIGPTTHRISLPSEPDFLCPTPLIVSVVDNPSENGVELYFCNKYTSIVV